MAASNMHNLTTLIKRLEAATSRLEDMAQATIDPGISSGPVPSATKSLPPTVNGTGAAGASHPAAADAARKPDPLPPAIEDFDKLINEKVSKFVKLSEELGGLVAKQASTVLRAFAAQRKVLLVATRAKKPDPMSPVYVEILSELQHEMGAVSDIREANRASPFFNHLCTVAEGIQGLVWITIEPKPAKYVEETLPSAQFYGNRVLKEYKTKDQKHVDWVQSYYQIFRSLASYVGEHYSMGVTWNNKDGIDPKEALKQVQSGQAGRTSLGAADAPEAAVAAGGPPPPPPPPPLPTFDSPTGPPSSVAKSAPKSGDMGAVFDQLNQGSSVTSGLRKVDRSEMTHKNPSLRTGATVPTRSDSASSTASRGKSPAPPGKKPKPESMRTKKPPRKELDGNKWIIENYENESTPIQIEANINHSILISRCTKTTIRVTGKANAISVDNSTRLALVIDSLVSSVDVIKAPNFALQVLGTLPTILLDQVDGASIYLAKSSLNTEVFSSKCSGINLNLPGAKEDDDFKEEPLPEQIRSYIKGGKVLNEIVEHAG